jgi:error-prone DNA polymerase
MLPAYAELHCLSNFSFLRGASHPEELIERAHALGYGAIALTDECSLAVIVRAHLAAKACGLQLLIGSEITLADGVKLVLLATDRASYGNLAQLITRGRRNAAKGTYALTREDVAAQAGGLLALWVPSADLAAARWVAATFPDRGWIAVELTVRAGERTRLHELAQLSQEAGLPLVAAGDVHMHARARRALQDTLTAIRVRKPLAECGRALFGNGDGGRHDAGRIHKRDFARLGRLHVRQENRADDQAPHQHGEHRGADPERLLRDALPELTAHDQQDVMHRRPSPGRALRSRRPSR